MKYVDWVEIVLKATVAAFDSNEAYASSTNVQSIVREIGEGVDERSEPLLDALHDLQGLGLITFHSLWHVTIDQEARKIRVSSLRTCWPTFHKSWLEPRQEAFLAKLCEMSEVREDSWAHLEQVFGIARSDLAAIDPHETLGREAMTAWHHRYPWSGQKVSLEKGAVRGARFKSGKT